MKIPNLTLMQRKQTLPLSRSSLRSASMVKPSSSALVSTERMCATSDRVRSSEGEEVRPADHVESWG